MPCPACEALPGQPSSVPPHAALEFTGSTSMSCGIAGTDTGENYHCTECDAHLYRHTGRLDARVWSRAASPEEEAAQAARPVCYLTADVRAALGPHGFSVDEASLPWGAFPQAWQELDATASHPGWTGREPHERRIYLCLSFPSGIGDDEAIRVGVSASPSDGTFSGPSFILRDLDHLRAAAPQLKAYFETNIKQHLCPRCRGLRTRKTRRRDGHPFTGCEHYENPIRDCRWTGPADREFAWPG